MYLMNERKVEHIYIINLQLVLYGCETWSPTLTEKRKLRAFEDRGLRKLFGSKRNEVTGERRRLHMRSFMIRTPHQISFE
jgi:hypothetical protein